MLHDGLIAIRDNEENHDKPQPHASTLAQRQ